MVQATGDGRQGVHPNLVVMRLLFKDGPALSLGEGPPDEESGTFISQAASWVMATVLTHHRTRFIDQNLVDNHELAARQVASISDSSHQAGLLRMRITAALRQLSLPIPACFATSPAFSSCVTYRSLEVTPRSSHCRLLPGDPDTGVGAAAGVKVTERNLAVAGRGSSPLTIVWLTMIQSPPSDEPEKDQSLVDMLNYLKSVNPRFV